MMNSKVFLAVVVVLLLFSPEDADAYWYPRRRYYGKSYGRKRYGYGRGVGAFYGGAALGFLGILGLGLLVGKKKRSVEGYDEEVEDVSPFEEALNRFDLAMEMDDDLCASKTLCEIMQTEEQLKYPFNEIKKVLNIIYSGQVPILGVEGHKEATELLDAGLLGKSSKIKNVCEIAFGSCTTDKETRMEEITEGYLMGKKYADKDEKNVRVLQ